MTEDKMVGWHHLLNGHEFEQALGNGEGQGSLKCCSPWCRKESTSTEQQKKTLLLVPKIYRTGASVRSENWRINDIEIAVEAMKMSEESRGRETKDIPFRE